MAAAIGPGIERGVHRIGWHTHVARNGHVGGWEPDGPSPLIALHDGATKLMGPAKQSGCSSYLAASQGPTNGG